MDFYKIPVDNWTCANIVEHYKSELPKTTRKILFDHIKKDLQRVALASSGFDVTRREKAQEILDSWMDWTATIKLKGKTLRHLLNRSQQKVEVLEAKQQELATENASKQMDVIQKKFVNYNIANLRKLCSEDQGDDNEVVRPSSKRKMTSSSSSTSLFNDQGGSESGSSFNMNEKNTSRNQDASLREESGVFDDKEDGERMQDSETSLAYTELENSADWISDGDKDVYEPCLPKEGHTEMTQRDEIDNDLGGRNWKKWASLLQEASKKFSSHKHCLENYSIIRCGAGIIPSDWMEKKMYQSLQAGLLKVDRTQFVDFKPYMSSILGEKSLKNMQQAICSRAPPIDEPRGSKHYVINRVFTQFAQEVFMPDNRDSDIKLSEICYNHLALWPCMYTAISGLTSNLGNLKFLPYVYQIPVKYSISLTLTYYIIWSQSGRGERYLEAIDEIRKFRHQEESHMKVDGIVCTEFANIELLSMEVTGHHGLHDKSRAGWDHVKGSCALLAMLSRIAYIFPQGSIELFQEVRVAFVHAHG
ncbi:hypothetical protein BC936DRAFT_146531 [Jimgerdemannia flammicorona]|uniref:Uncharacterized protein n=1 Tax=Jimgerdemannia flammicorona TaxID=994334 RepID=A0A433D7G1_9FUNG|nr:hypothetical protein BC936DRAFT_146531 [Jimgerdemannia flammicorona]